MYLRSIQQDEANEKNEGLDLIFETSDIDYLGIQLFKTNVCLFSPVSLI